MCSPIRLTLPAPTDQARQPAIRRTPHSEIPPGKAINPNTTVNHLARGQRRPDAPRKSPKTWISASGSGAAPLPEQSHHHTRAPKKRTPELAAPHAPWITTFAEDQAREDGADAAADDDDDDDEEGEDQEEEVGKGQDLLRRR